MRLMIIDVCKLVGKKGGFILVCSMMEAIVLFIMLHLAQNSNKARSIGYLNSPVLLRVRLNDKPPI